MRTYRTLALVGTFIKIIGWLTVVGTLLSACALLVLGTVGGLALPGLAGIRFRASELAAGAAGQVIAAVLYVLAGLVLGALQIALAELIELFIDLSVSSQRSVQLLERLVRTPLQPPAPPQPPAATMPAPGAYPPQGYQAQ